MPQKLKHLERKETLSFLQRIIRHRKRACFGGKETRALEPMGESSGWVVPY